MVQKYVMLESGVLQQALGGLSVLRGASLPVVYSLLSLRRRTMMTDREQTLSL